MTTTQAEVMINTMEVAKYELAEDVSLEFMDLSEPIHNLFDECLNFMSVNDFNI